MKSYFLYLSAILICLSSFSLTLDTLPKDEAPIETESLNRAKRIPQRACAKPCLNDGMCINNKCYCKTGYFGDQCQEKWKKCTGSPKMFTFSMLFTNGTQGQVNCLEGFSLKDGRTSFALTCINNEWVYDGKPPDLAPECAAQCKPDCENGGTCKFPGICECPPEYTGILCEKKTCTSEVPSMEQLLDKINVNLFCPNGFSFDKRRVKVNIDCEVPTWLVTFTQVHCNPICRPSCQYYGKCIGPNVCQCKKGFIGDHCQSKQCIDGPNVIRHMNFIKINASTYSASCVKHYSVRADASQLTATCSDGNWSYSMPFNINFPPTCYPSCQKSCVNGGYCIGLNICKCPEGFTGNFCEKRYSLAVSGKNCVFPFKYKGQTYLGCTRADHSKPWCATKTDSGGEIVEWEMCYADLGWTRLVKSQNGSPCQLPFTGGKNNNTTFHHCIHDELLPLDAKTNCLVTKETETFSSDCVPEIGTKLEEIVYLSNGESCQLVKNSSNYELCVEGASGQLSFCQRIQKTSPQRFCLQDNGMRRCEITESGDPCVFPFALHDTMLSKCVSLRGEAKWCTTKVDDKGAPIEKGNCVPSYDDDKFKNDFTLTFLRYTDKNKDYNGKYVLSTEIVDTAGARRCVFPFFHNGKLHYECVTEEQSTPWCATKVDDSLTPVDSDICLPNIEHYYQKLQDIQYAYKGHKSETSLKRLIGEIDAINKKTFLHYTTSLGWQRFALMLRGFRVFLSPPHKQMMLRSVESDEYLANEIKKDGLMSEERLKSIGIGGILEMFGRSCSPNDRNRQMKIDYTRSNLEVKIENFLNKRNIPASNELAESYVIGMRDFNTDDLNGEEFFNETKWFGFTNRDIPEGSGNPGISELDCVLPTSVTDEICKPHLYKGRWYGLGSCIRESGESDYKCATVTNQKSEPLTFSRCRMQEESEGGWPAYLQNPRTYIERNVILTKTGEPCSLPFLHLGLSFNSCVPISHQNPVIQNVFGITKTFCPTLLNDNLTATELRECDRMAEVYNEPTLSQSATTESFVIRGRKNENPFYDSAEEAPVLGTREKPMEAKTAFNNDCVFPFTYNDVTYKECVSDGSEDPWCPTQLYSHGAIKIKESCLNKDSYAVITTTESSSLLEGAKAMPFQGTSTIPSKSLEEDMVMFNLKKTEDDNADFVPRLDYIDNIEDNETKISYEEYTSNVTNSTSEWGEDSQISSVMENHIIEPFKILRIEYEEEFAEASMLLFDTTVNPTMIQTVSDRECLLPFQYNGKTYHECTEDERGYKWCPVELFPNGTLKSVEECLEASESAAQAQAQAQSQTQDQAKAQAQAQPQTQDQAKAQAQAQPQTQDQAKAQAQAQPQTQDQAKAQAQAQPQTQDQAKAQAEAEKPEKSEKSCIFPYTYKGTIYNNCTSVDSKDPWCPTQVDSEQRPLQGQYCTGEERDATHATSHNIVFTLDGFLCEFPFQYEGKEYNECVVLEHIRPWCKVNKGCTHRIQATGECRLQLEFGNEEYTTPASIEDLSPFERRTLNGEKCIFPFTYNGNTYNDCTTDDETVGLWCATELDHNGYVMIKDICSLD